jgi:hypothetical protein
MLDIILLGCAAAFFPTLLAGVVVMLSRPHPARLLLAFWIGGMTVSITAGILILHQFRHSAAVAGSTKHHVSVTVYLVGGIIALLLAALMGTPQGRRLRENWRRRHPKKVKPDKHRDPWAERVLARGSMPVAAVVGGVINLPGPYYLIALGQMAADKMPQGEALAGILIFNVLMFALVEGPLIGYILRPDATSAIVDRLAAALNRNGLRIIALILAVFGTVMIVKGVKLI